MPVFSPKHLGGVMYWCNRCGKEGVYVAKKKDGEEAPKTPADLLFDEMKAAGGKAPRKINVKHYRFPNAKLATVMADYKFKAGVVGSRCGVDPGIVSSLAKGRNTNLAAAIKVAAFFGKSVESLFGVPEEYTPTTKAEDPPADKPAEPSIDDMAKEARRIADEAADKVKRPLTEKLFEEPGDGAYGKA